MTRREDLLLQEKLTFAHEHGSLTADTVVKLWQVPAGRKFRIDRVFYNNPTGLVEDAANYFNVIVQNGTGSVLAANHSTETGQEGTLTADTPVELVLAADGVERVLSAGDDLEVNFDETGTATLPAGRIVIEGRLL